MRIKWKFAYYPYGGWIDENGNDVNVRGNFPCTCNGQELIMVYKPVHCPPGHGEPAMTGSEPSFIDRETLEPVTVEEYVEIDASLVLSQ